MKLNEQEEYELAVQAHSGDRDALSELVERLRLRLFATAYAELQHYDDAQDAVSSALVRICSHISDLRDIERFRAWMHAIVRNETRSIQRQRLTGAAHRSLQEVSELPAPPQLSALRLDVEQALRRLPADHAHTLALFYLKNLSIREIARRTNRPEGTIKSWLHHGRRQLAQSMKEYAPMTPTEPTEWTAAIVSDSLEPSALNSLSDALRAAGFSRVNLFHDFREIISKGDFRLAEAPDSPKGKTDTKMLHLPDSLKGTDFVILDQRIGSHSAFELNLILRAAEKEDNIIMAHCILLDPFDPTDEEATHISVFASWLSGFDLCLTKPVKPEEFESLARRLRESMVSQ
jgi:RNA polymerase sigma-70 factor (ECF subfamily)